MPWVFTYGISTDPDQMLQDVGHFYNYQRASLKDYVYTFTGSHPDFEFGGTSTVLPLVGGEVLGVAYEIADEKLTNLVEQGHGYILKEKTAIFSGEERAVYLLEPKEVMEKKQPASNYVEKVRSGLTKHYPAVLVDCYLKRAVKRTGTDLITKRSSNTDGYQWEYGSHFRRLFPWEATRTSPFGSAWAIVEPGERTTPHNHDEEETFIFLNGEGEMTVDGQSFSVTKGDAVYMEPFAVHTVKNVGDEPLEILCIWWGELAKS